MRKTFILLIISVLPIFVFGQNINNKKIERHFKRASTALQAKNYEDAIKEYEWVINSYPEYPDAYYNLALVYEQISDIFYIKEAIRNYKKYIELVPSKADEINEKIYNLEYANEDKNEIKPPIIINKYQLKRAIASVGINALWSKSPDYYYYDNGYYYSDYNEEEIYKFSNGKGFSINTDLLFLSKKQLDKNTKCGFSMTLDMSLFFLNLSHTYNRYVDNILEKTENRSDSGIGFNIQYLFGFSGISKTYNKFHITYGIYPAGIITGFISANELDGEVGLTHSANLGIGLQVSKKCIINPNFRFSYCSISNFSKPQFFQVGLNFIFLGYRKYQ